MQNKMASGSEIEIDAAVRKEIALDLISSFIIQLADQFSEEIAQFLTGTTPDAAVKDLADVVVGSGIGFSETEARIAIVPALISRGFLRCWPMGYNPPDELTGVQFHRRGEGDVGPRFTVSPSASQ